MKSEAFFFDFDGVLVDSVLVKAKAFAALFDSYGSKVKKKVIEHHLNNGGMTRKDKIQYYFENFLNRSIDIKTLNGYCDKFSKIVESEVAAALEIKGATFFLQKVFEKTKCFIVSATPDDELERIVEKRKLKRYFIEILGSDRSKPANLTYLLKKYHLNNSNCIFFGDAMSDYNAAKQCLIPFVGILPDQDAPLLRTAPDIKWVKDFNHYSKASS